MASSSTRGNFRSFGKYDQLLINVLRCILEKFGQLNRYMHLCFIDFKQVSLNKYNTFMQILKEFGIPKKLVNLIKMTQDSERKVKI
jgi:hypothetical protein